MASFSQVGHELAGDLLAPSQLPHPALKFRALHKFHPRTVLSDPSRATSLPLAYGSVRQPYLGFGLLRPFDGSLGDHNPPPRKTCIRSSLLRICWATPPVARPASGTHGSITGFDTINHKVIAKAVTDIEIRSGDTATAGGRVFTALQDGWVVAYSDETLEELWHFNVGTALKGGPVTYAIGPKQYLAVQAGGRHLHPVKYDKLQDSSYLFVFALN